MCHNLYDGGVFNCVESLLKIQLENDYFLLTLMALMDIFIALGKAILYCASADETVLILMNQSEDHNLQTVC